MMMLRIGFGLTGLTGGLFSVATRSVGSGPRAGARA